MKRRLIALLLCFAMVLPILPANAAEEEFAVYHDGSSVSSVVLPQYDKVELTAEGEQTSGYQWQIHVSGDMWVDISGADSATLNLSYAMVASLLDDGAAKVRCKATQSGSTVVTDGVTVSVDYSVEPELVPAENTDPVVVSPAKELDSDAEVEATEPDYEALGNAVEAAMEKVSAAEAELNLAKEEAAVAAANADAAATNAAAKAEAASAAEANAQNAEAAVKAAEEAAALPVDETEEPVSEESTVDTEEVPAVDSELIAAAEAARAEADAAAAEAEAAAQASADAEAAKAAADKKVAEAQAAYDAALAEQTAAEEAYMAANSPAIASFALEADAESNALTTHMFTILYLIKDSETGVDRQIASPHLAEVADGGSYIKEIQSPVIQGYTTDTLVYSANITNMTAPVTVSIYYNPGEVNYTVKHYQQNVDGDGYTLVDTETKTGLTDSYVGDVAKDYTGFTNLLYERPQIAADGSTVVEIYYDRVYTLINFDLDGGYGVEPIYARYGSSVGTVATPKKAGYNFAGWTLDGDAATIPATVPAQNVTYTATWAVDGTTVTIVYWLENADDDGYSYWGSRNVSAVPGTIVNGEDYKDYSSIAADLDTYEKRYSTYSSADTNVEVKGDGSTVVNVYYDRNEYTLKFYYAMNGGGNYYVIGGSTYRFGASATINDTGNEVSLLNHYMSDYTSERGEVETLPTLNETGSSRNYIAGTDSASVTSGNGGTTDYTYYYIAFTAKYGADISELWPCNVFNSVTRVGTGSNGWNGDQAFVSAWNGEHNVYYSQNNRNQTIKGNYNELDYQLLWDTQFGEPSDDTVTYLCFWENAGDITWNVPELYRYKIYVPLLEGQDTTGLTIREYEDTTYYEYVTYDTVDDSKVEEQTAPAINGFTYLNQYEYLDWTEQMTDAESELYREAYDVYFYYSRDVYDLTFQNVSEVVKTDKVPFETDISGKYFIPDYPVNLEEGAYEFGGWYTTEQCYTGSEFTFDDATMPASNIILYAKWAPVTHTVKVYLTENSTTTLIADQTVSHNSVAVAPDDELVVNSSYTFVGWFYKENGVEKAFDFSMPVTKDLILYGKWSSNVEKQFTIYYQLEDGTDIAAPTKGAGLVGNSKTFEAKVGEELYLEYQDGYFPTTMSHTITLNIDDEDNSGDNTYTFIYTKTTVSYTVKYVDEDGKDVADPKVVSDNTKSYVTETFVPVLGLLPDQYQKSLALSTDMTDEERVITFVYTVDTTRGVYALTHWKKDTSGEWVSAGTTTQGIADVGTLISADDIELTGYTYDPSKTVYVVGGGEPQTYNAPVELTYEGVEIRHYYIENEVTITYEVVGPDGCGTVSPSSEPVKIYTGTAAGSTAEPSSDVYRFVGWYADEACTIPVNATYQNETFVPAKSGSEWTAVTYYAKFEYNLTTMTITKSKDSTLYDADDTFIFQISGNDSTFKISMKAGESVTISNIVVGTTYTITEITAGSRYEPVAAQTLTAAVAGSDNVVTFVNTLSQDKWLSDTDSATNVFNAPADSE